ncbi:MAG: CoA transferase [Acidimicrobiales bacterium]|nr:CoA transferase [Acidimicrobiales bacterium]
MQGLEGIRVLELGGGVAAGYATKLLADLGAEVVKVEASGGDPVRRRGPWRPGLEDDPDTGGLFVYLNTNKRSVRREAIDLDRLVAGCDLVVHELPAEQWTAWGLDPARWRVTDPSLVICSLSPFGLEGPYARYRATELGVVHGGGWAWLAPGASERPDLPPLRPPVDLAALQSASGAALCALACVDRAQRSGIGAHIDYSMQSHVASMLEAAFIAWSYPGWNPDRMGVRTLNPWGIFRARDGLVFLVCVEQDQWERLVELMGDPEWAQSELFATAPDRNQVAEALFGLVESFTAEHTVEYLWHEGQQRRIAFAPVFTMEDLSKQAHLRERGWFATVEQPGLGRIELPGQPAIVQPAGGSRGVARWALRDPAPRLGADTAPEWDPKPPPGNAVDGAAAPPRPLEGVRVLDFSWVWAGPFATLHLAHLGADVIKVENPQRLCLGRRLPFHPPGVEPTIDTSGYFNQWNQGKRSISLDLTRLEGLEVARRLAATADVVVDNFAVGVMERLGLGEEALRAINPDVIVASISGYGQRGPLRSYMGYGPTTSPLSGIASMTGYEPGDGPRELGIAFGDPAAGIACAWSIVAALVARRRTGTASRIDTSLWEATAVNGGEGWMHWLLRGEEAPRIGNRHHRWAPHNCYRCALDAPERSNGPDAGDFVTIAVTSDAEWDALRAVVDPDTTLGLDGRFATTEGRKRHEDDLDAILAGWCATRSRWAVTELLQHAGVAAFPTLSPKDLADDPHLRARRVLTERPHPLVGLRTHTGVPWLIEGEDATVRCAAPMLGQHTDEVLGEVLGLDEVAIAALRGAGALG